VLVIEPDEEVFRDMQHKQHLFPSVQGRSDQEFLQQYLHQWVRQPELHLDHVYNMCTGHLDRYHELFGYDLTERPGPNSVKVLHYWGTEKPWKAKPPLHPGRSLYQRAHALWWEAYNQARQRRALRHEARPPAAPLQAG
jgi:lipopolysaccharide biosynthesis glycosyltransferase